MLVVLVGCNVALLIYLAIRVGYVSERHTVLLTLLACQFAAAGLPLFAAGLGQLLPRVERLGVRITASGILATLVALSLPFALKPMHQHREGHKHAGLWLAHHITDKDAIIDPFCWAEWYAGPHAVPHIVESEGVSEHLRDLGKHFRHAALTAPLAPGSEAIAGRARRSGSFTTGLRTCRRTRPESRSTNWVRISG